MVWLKIKCNQVLSRPEDPAVIRTNMYDTLTPEYKFYHTLEEASAWYLKYGFSNPRQTHKTSSE